MPLNVEKQRQLTAEILRERILYDPICGKVTWRRARCSNRVGREIGQITLAGYRSVIFPEGRFQVHRLVWLYVYGRWPDGEIDHINADRADNRICNLRECTRLQNIANRAAQNGRKMKGITFHKRAQKWQAQIRLDGKNVYLGSFESPELAHAAYMAKAVQVYGAFARAA